MSRMESVVVEAAPSSVNQKIHQMEAFGWDLVSQQEVVQEGNTVAVVHSSGDVTSSTKLHKYVKLHFQRRVDLPNLDRIRPLEVEFGNIQFLLPNTSLKWPLIIVGLGVLEWFGGGMHVFPAMAGLLIIGAGGFWAYSRVQAGQKASAANEEGLSRQQQLMHEAKVLLS